MKKLTYEERVRRVLSPVLQELVEARKKDDGKSGHPALCKLLAENATVTEYRLSGVLWLESVELYWHDCIVIDTQGAGQLKFRDRYESDDCETLTLEFPRDIRAALCNGIEVFAQDKLRKAVDKYGI